MKKYSIVLVLITLAHHLHAQEVTSTQELSIDSLDNDAERKIYNSLFIRDSLQVGALIVSSDGTINALDVTGNTNVGGSLNVQGTLTINGTPVSTGSSSGGTGNVVGPTSATTPTAVVLFTDTTGKAIEQSANNPVTSTPVTIDSSTNVANINNLTATANINLPATATDYSQGVITINGNNFIHAITHNTAVGLGALSNIGAHSGAQNIGIGENALQALQTGSGNIAIGINTLGNNIAGNTNIAIGRGVLLSNNNNDNIGIGEEALTNTGGQKNVAIGSLALRNIGSNSAISNNIAIGFNAGVNLNNSSSNSNNIYIGSLGPSVSGAESNTTRIGSAQTACFIAGIRGITTGQANAINVLVDSNGQLGTVSSSARYKKDITTMESITSALMQLRPVRFRYKVHDETTPYEYGLIAEEVEAILPNLVIYKDGQPETVKYHLLSTLLLKAVQELTAQNSEQQQVIAQLMHRITALEARVTT